MRLFKYLAVSLLLLSAAHAQQTSVGTASKPDPGFLGDGRNPVALTYPYLVTSGLTIKSQAYNPASTTLILIVAGQSNHTDVQPSLYTPTNASAIDNFNPYDGASYSVSGSTPIIGVQWGLNNPGGGGNPALRVADTLITNGNFARVILAPIAVGGSAAADWATGGEQPRFSGAMAKLAERGYVPGNTGLTFAVIWGQGEAEAALSTSQATYTSEMTSIVNTLVATGFNGRFFINEETWDAGSTYAPVQAAQLALPNGTTIFAGADMDSLNNTDRQADETHLNDAGAAAYAALLITAMHNSGPPF